MSEEPAPGAGRADRAPRFRLASRILLAVVTLGVVAAIVVLSTLPEGATPSALAAPAGDPVIAAAGDIACDPLNGSFNGGSGSSGSCRQRYTSDLLVNAGLSAVLLLGDNQYYCGGYQAYLGSYDLSWGRVKGITFPAVGNHEYITSPGSSAATGCDLSNAGAQGHYRYFGAAAGDPSKGYYSFDIGTWHLIMLNSQCSSAGGCSPTTPQGQWLRADLAAHANYCTLAFWHIPLFSSGGRASATYRTFWDALYAADADVVLNGHDHTYERFAPQNPTGGADPARGIREFVVGTGGANHTSFTGVWANSEVRDSSTFGVLKMTLHPTSYDWQFVRETGGNGTFTDSGTGQCHGNQTDTQPPTAPGNLTAPTVTPGSVSLAWNPSMDNTGVAGYRVFRGGAQIATTTGTTYTDTSVVPSTAYSYTVAAYDAAGLQSPPSNTLNVTTPPDPTPPTQPTGLTAPTVTSSRVDLAWNASTDNVAISHYEVVRGSQQIGTSPTPTYSDTTVQPSSPYQYQVRAVDTAGNPSPLSTPLNVTTPAPPSTLSFAPTDDAYVDQTLPTSSFGSVTSLQVDGSPVKRFLMRFSVTGVGGRTVLSAKLRLHCIDPASVGGVFHRITGGAWNEGTVSWNTQPTYSSAVLASLGTVAAGTWYEVDVASLVTGDGTYEIAVDSASTNGADYVSAEGTASLAPELVVTTAAAPAIAPPTGLTAQPASPTGVNLSWTASTSAGVVGYRVSRGGTEIGTTAGTSFPDSGLAPGTAYQYEVRANDAAGNQSAPATASATTPGIAPPILQSAQVLSPTSVKLDWTASGDGNVTGYRIYRGTTAIATVTVPNATYTDTAAAPNTTYSYTVTAFYAVNGPESVQSAAATATTLPIAPPTALGAQALSPTGVRLDWTASTDGSVTAYRVYRATTGSPVQIATGVTGVTYTDTGAAPNTAYSYTVTALYPSGTESAPSNTATATTAADQAPPTAPTNLMATADGPLRVSLSWTASMDDVGVDHYSVLRDGLPIATPSTASYSDTTVQPGTPYQYTVVAYDAAGHPSVASDPATVTTPAIAPPTGLTAAAASTTSVNLSWTPSLDSGVTGYRIRRDGAAIATTTGATYTNTGLTPGTSYAYAVTAFYTASGPESAAATATASTPAAPSTLTFNPVADSYVNETSPTTNYGTSTQVRIDGSPLVRTYLRFTVTGVSGTIASAKLRIFANSSSTTGHQVRAVADTTWGETTINYTNAPAFGALPAASSGAFPAGAYVEVDITSLIAGNGTYSLALTGPGSTAVSLASRESATKPQLVVNMS